MCEGNERGRVRERMSEILQLFEANEGRGKTEETLLRTQRIQFETKQNINRNKFTKRVFLSFLYDHLIKKRKFLILVDITMSTRRRAYEVLFLVS